ISVGRRLTIWPRDRVKFLVGGISVICLWCADPGENWRIELEALIEVIPRKSCLVAAWIGNRGHIAAIIICHSDGAGIWERDQCQAATRIIRITRAVGQGIGYRA